MWIRTRGGRAYLSQKAAEREVLKLAQRAGCSLEIAKFRRAGGWRWCPTHGWYRQTQCMPCKVQRARDDRAARRTA